MHGLLWGFVKDFIVENKCLRLFYQLNKVDRRVFLDLSWILVFNYLAFSQCLQKVCEDCIAFSEMKR
jgi:hypothetical protein